MVKILMKNAGMSVIYQYVDEEIPEKTNSHIVNYVKGMPDNAKAREYEALSRLKGGNLTVRENVPFSRRRLVALRDELNNKVLLNN